MKKNVLLLMASTLVCLVACNKETELPNDEPTGQGNDVITEVVGAGLDKNETKADISDGLKFSWRNGSDRAGDYVAFWNGSTFVRSAASSAASASTTFNITYSGTRSEYAYYPYYIVQDIDTDVDGTGKLSAAGTTRVVLPSTYDYAEVSGTNTPCPMIAANVPGEGWAFKQLCGLLRLTVPAIPSKADELVITFDKVVTGAFTVTGADTAIPYITVGTGTSTISIILTPGADYCGAVVNIPVPIGDDISVTSVVAKASGNLLATSITPTILSEWDVARKHGKKATAAFKPSIGSLLIAPGNLYTNESGALLMADAWYNHMYVLSGAVDGETVDNKADDVTKNSFESASTYSIKNRTHFNWNEVYHLLNNTALEDGTAGYSLASTNTSSEDSDITYDLHNVFGGKTWRLPTRADVWELGDENDTRRPGARVGNINKYYKGIKVLVTGMDPNSGTTWYYTDKDVTSNGVTINYPEICRSQNGAWLIPSNTYQAGLLLFPDNVQLENLFTDGNIATDRINFRTRNYHPSIITKENLAVLIEQGCAFLPALGHWSNWWTSARFNGVGTYGNYWTSTQKNDGAAKVFSFNEVLYLHPNQENNYAGYQAARPEGGENKKDFESVRLVRDVE